MAVFPQLEGRTLNHYRILHKLGGGGMGVVLEGEDLRLGRHVAMERLKARPYRFREAENPTRGLPDSARSMRPMR